MFRASFPMLPLAARMTRNARASRQANVAWRALGPSLTALLLALVVATPARAQLPTPPDTQGVQNNASLS